MLILSPDHITQTTVNTLSQLLPESLTQNCLCKYVAAKYEFQYIIWIRFYLYPNLISACREICKSELQVKFIIIASSKTRQLTEIPLYTVIFRAPPRAMRVILQRKMTVTIILGAPFLEKARLK